MSKPSLAGFCGKIGPRGILTQALRTLLFCVLAISQTSPAADRWWKGNLHTHTLWSDGDDYPEMVAAWYKDQGYHFLALSDHNIVLQNEKWIHAVTNRGGPHALSRYTAKFGKPWVQRRVRGDRPEVRLRPLEEFRSLVERPGRFLLIASEEITDHFLKLPVHLNATNLRDLIKPRGGTSVLDVLQRNVDAVLEQRRQTGQIMIPHVNHPNFGWALTADDLMRVQGERFFEVYNGHPGVYNEGNKKRLGTERMWDVILTWRLTVLQMEPMYALAVDDAHNYHTMSSTRSNPGRGWIMVRAAQLTPAAIISAMEAGDFYASSGVRLSSIRQTPQEMSLKIDGAPGVTYLTRFLGTKRNFALPRDAAEPSDAARDNPDVGAILAEVAGRTPAYRFRGDELYVRATVISSQLKKNPYREGEVEMAWVQPVILGAR